MSCNMTPSEIKALRKSFNMSQATFAKALNVGETTIKRYETGVHPAQGATLLLLKLLEQDPFLIQSYMRITLNNFTDQEIERFYN